MLIFVFLLIFSFFSVSIFYFFVFFHHISFLTGAHAHKAQPSSAVNIIWGKQGESNRIIFMGRQRMGVVECT